MTIEGFFFSKIEFNLGNITEPISKRRDKKGQIKKENGNRVVPILSDLVILFACFY